MPKSPEDMMMMESEYSDKAAGLQDSVDAMLIVPRGRFGKAALNALVDAFNKALTSGGFEGDYPKFDGDQTSLPIDFVRGLAMMSDAAAESGANVEISLEGVESDRDLASLAAKLSALADSEEFKSMMSEDEGPELEVEVSASKPKAKSAEDLMMERA